MNFGFSHSFGAAAAPRRSTVSQLRAIGFDSILLADFGSYQSEGGPVAQIGDPVGYVQGQSGNATDYAEQTVEETRPTLAAGLNGRKAWLFSGAHNLSSPDERTGYDALENNTAIAVFQPTSNPAGDSDWATVMISPAVRIVTNTPSHKWGTYNGSTESNGTTTLENGGSYLMTLLESDAPSIDLRLNGELEATFGLKSVGGVGRMDIGSEGGGRFSHGKLYASLTSRTRLSDAAVIRAEVLLADRYGIYHPSARWITRYSTTQQAAIHAAKLTREQADAMTADTDMVSWVTRSGNNGGRFIGTNTLTAHKTFLNALNAAGIRSKIKRASTFAGSNLAACMTPIIAEVGFPQEGNFGFVEGDYSETVGLTGAGDAGGKYLDTGLIPYSTLTPGNAHNGVYCFSESENLNVTGCSSPNFWIFNENGGVTSDNGNRVFNAPLSPRAGMLLDSDINPSHSLWVRGTKVHEVISLLPDFPSANYYAMAGNNNGSASYFWHAACGGYTVGEGLSDGQAVVYSAAFKTVQEAIGRPAV